MPVVLRDACRKNPHNRAGFLASADEVIESAKIADGAIREVRLWRIGRTVHAKTKGRRAAATRPSALRKGGRGHRFAVEDFPTMHTLGAWMQVGDERFNSDEIQSLYESSDYPRRRRKCKSQAARAL